MEGKCRFFFYRKEGRKERRKEGRKERYSYFEVKPNLFL
jgi:hypothetical protein